MYGRKGLDICRVTAVGSSLMELEISGMLLTVAVRESVFTHIELCKYLSLETSVWSHERNEVASPSNVPTSDEWGRMRLSILKTV